MLLLMIIKSKYEVHNEDLGLHTLVQSKGRVNSEQCEDNKYNAHYEWNVEILKREFK